MAPLEKTTLSKEDLYLLMESYRNTIELNSSIVAQLSRIYELLMEVNKILEKECSLVNQVDNLLEVIRDLIQRHIDKTENKLEEIAKNQLEKYPIVLDHLDSNFIRLTHQIRLLWYGIGSIVIGLISIVINLID